MDAAGEAAGGSREFYFAAGRSLADLFDATSSRCLCGFAGRCGPSVQAFRASSGMLSVFGSIASSWNSLVTR